MSYHNISNPAKNTQRQTVNAQGQSAPAGYHYMLDGSLMLDTDMSYAVIDNFNLDLYDLPYSGETRKFHIDASGEAKFILQITNEDAYYYNFTTKQFQETPSMLEGGVNSGIYTNEITFPAVTSGVYSNIAARNDKVTGTVNGNVTASTTVVLDQTIESLGISVGDRVTGNTALNGEIVYVATIPSTNTFTLSTAATISNDTVLSFYGRQYNIYLYAIPGTVHAPYSEVRFLDDSLDINNSSGSTSLMMQKVIYQKADLELTISGFAPNGTVTGTGNTDTIYMDGLRYKGKSPFSFSWTTSPTAAYMILKQPSSSDVLAFIEPVVGAAPVTLPGENIYPAFTGTDTLRAASGTLVTMTEPVADTMKVGDRVTGMIQSIHAPVVTVVSMYPTEPNAGPKQFTASENIDPTGPPLLYFENQMNYSWPVTNFADKIKAGMIVVYDGVNVTTGTVVSDYKNQVTILEGTEKEQVIVKNKIQAVDTKTKKPNMIKGLITVQPGDITFNKQQVLALAGNTLNVGGYGEGEISRIFGWDVRFTDLKVTLTAPTTTTTLATTTSTITVANTEGVINGVSRVRGIGINSALQNPLITGGGGATGPGTWTADAAQTLENGITLTIENTSRTATITGNIEVLKAGTANQRLRFDIEKIISNG
jgi:hypothetical protein